VLSYTVFGISGIFEETESVKFWKFKSIFKIVLFIHLGAGHQDPSNTKHMNYTPSPQVSFKLVTKCGVTHID
jgi:hypothetical protein